jgi:hypothetical protein
MKTWAPKSEFPAILGGVRPEDLFCCISYQFIFQLEFPIPCYRYQMVIETITENTIW